MRFIIDFLTWSAVVYVLLGIPLVVRAWRNEVLRQDDPQFRSTSWFGAFVRFVHRLTTRRPGDDPPEE